MLIGINKRSETIVFDRALAIADLNLGVGNGPAPVACFRFSTAEKMRFLDCVQFSSARRKKFRRRLDVSLLIRNVVFV